MIRPTGISHVGIRTLDLDRFRSFYADVIGVDVLVRFGPAGNRAAVIGVGGTDTFVVFETGPGEARPDGLGLDHIGFTVPDEAALREVADRLVAAGASDGTVRPEGPVLAVDFHDPDGTRGEINCFRADFDESMFPPDHEILEPMWLDRTRRILTGA